jgi:hypothetical protein
MLAEEFGGPGENLLSLAALLQLLGFAEYYGVAGSGPGRGLGHLIRLHYRQDWGF